MKKTLYTIHGHEGVWTIKNSWISDLGYVMIAFWNEDKHVTMNVSTGTTLEQALQLPWVNTSEPDETNSPDITTIY